MKAKVLNLYKTFNKIKSDVDVDLLIKYEAKTLSKLVQSVSVEEIFAITEILKTLAALPMKNLVRHYDGLVPYSGAINHV